jgi:Macrophage migration inhibitory factor (MIF).
MPHIIVNTNLTLEKSQKDALKDAFGKDITILPGKTESVLMVDISDGHTMYFRGEELEEVAHVEVRLYGSSSFEAKAEFTRALYKIIKDIIGIKEDDVTVCIGEYPVWGARGNLK